LLALGGLSRLELRTNKGMHHNDQGASPFLLDFLKVLSSSCPCSCSTELFSITLFFRAFCAAIGRRDWSPTPEAEKGALLDLQKVKNPC
jgi:hypothetical protein